MVEGVDLTKQRGKLNDLIGLVFLFLLKFFQNRGLFIEIMVVG